MRRRLLPKALDRSNAPKKRALGHVVGLDLSLTATGMCALPLDWSFALEEVKTSTCGYALDAGATARERIVRATEIADAVFDFCKAHQARAVYVENHAFGAGGARANETIEMTGIVKAKLFDDWGIVVEPVVASSARKTLLQKLPSPRGQKRGALKAWVVANVRRLGGPALGWSEDEVDAFVCANMGLMLRGGTAMTFLGQ